MKLAVVYHSESGNTEKIAHLIANGANQIQNVEAKTMSISNINDEFLNSSQAVIFGSPTYHADFSWQLKKWFDKSAKYDLAGKLGAAFATENYLGGGADFALLTIIGHLLVKGMVVYSAGSGEGHPYTHYGAVCLKAGNKEQQKRAEIFGNRIASKAISIFDN